MDKKLPRYKITRDPSLSDGEKLGIRQVAHVAEPAILTRGVAFSKETVKNLKFEDQIKMRVAGPGMIPNLPIPRKDEELGEYEVIFSEEEIELLVKQFMRDNVKAAFNLDHNTELESPSYILEAWFVRDPLTDISKTTYGIEVPKGTWFIVSQFTDKKYFDDEIVAQDRLGFSIEGLLGLALADITKQIKQEKMNNKFEKATTESGETILIAKKHKYDKAKLDDGTPLWIDALQTDSAIYTVNDDAEKEPLKDGEYKLDSGVALSVKDGKIAELKKADDKPAKPEGEVPAKLADEPAAPDAPAETEPKADAAIDETVINNLVDAKLEPILKAIADLKTLIEADASEDAQEDAVAPAKLSAMQIYKAFKKLNKN
ncbi:MAG: XkdF-like putative serine protease domain-containing protein [Bacteroidia bacterium]